MLDTIERERVDALTIVGDAFAKPMLRALDADPAAGTCRRSCSSPRRASCGPRRVKQGLLKHNPGMLLVDAFSSSEAIGLGQSVSAAGAEEQTANFSARRQRPGHHRRRPRRGRPARARGSGRGPRLTSRSATTRTPRSRRPRSSRSTATGTRSPATTPRSRPTARSPCSAAARCASTPGGEKVFPEEVEEVLKEHPTVADAVVVGVPDDKFGEAITAVVELQPGADARRAGADRPRQGQAGAVQGAEAGAARSTPSAAPPTARSTTAG